MSAELAAAVTLHLDDQGYEYATDHPDTTRRMGLDIAAVAHAVGYRKPRTITTLDELDALPFEAVLRDFDGHVLERWGHPSENLWATVMVNAYIPRGDISLPATVLFDPEASK